MAGVVPERMGNEHPSIAPYAVFPTGDGRLVLAVGTDRQFQSLCEVIGAPALAQDARFVTNPARVANREALRAELESRLATRPASDWALHLTEARVPAGVVNDIAAAFALARRSASTRSSSSPAANGSSIASPAQPDPSVAHPAQLSLGAAAAAALAAFPLQPERCRRPAQFVNRLGRRPGIYSRNWVSG